MRRDGHAGGDTPRLQLDRRLDELADAPGPILVVTDFDGTLSPIVADPPRAAILPAARSALRRLAAIGVAHPDRVVVAVLTGRGVEDIVDRVRVGGVRYVGNHGLEWARLPRGARPGRLAVEHEPGLAAAVRDARRLARRVEADLGRPDWLFVEPKGPAVAFHYRLAPDPRAARRAIEAAARDAAETLAPIHGRRVVEFRPRGDAGKGGATARLLREERPARVLALGDDRTDAAAFEVVRQWRESDPDGVAGTGIRRRAVLVGVRSTAEIPPETPPELVAASDVLVDGPRDATRVLGRLARRLEHGSSPGPEPGS